jgi:uncharacterized membrane protein
MFIGGVIIALIAVLVILAVMKFIPATRPYIISVLVLIVGIWTGWLWAFLAAVPFWIYMVIVVMIVALTAFVRWAWAQNDLTVYVIEKAEKVADKAIESDD